LVVFTVDGVGARHYDVTGTMTSNFFYNHPQLFSCGGRGAVKICMMQFSLVGHLFRAKLRLCHIIISGVFLVSGMPRV